MTDNNDLLLGGAEAAPAPKKAADPKKRVRRTKAQIAADNMKTEITGKRAESVVLDDPLNAPVVPASTKPVTFKEFPHAGETPPMTATSKFDEVADETPKHAEGSLEAFMAGLDPELAKRLAPEAAPEVEDDGLISVPEPDGSTSVQLPPISLEYAKALGERVITIGQVQRTYAYQRVLRAGKKL